MKAADHDIDSLIGRQLAGELTPEETVALTAWKQQSTENQTYYNHLKTIFETSKNLKTAEVFDTDAAWQQLKQKITTRNQQPYTPQFFIRLAASIVLVMAAGVLVYQKFFTEQDVQLLSTTLELKNNVLPDGTDVFMNKNSTLVYGYDPLKKIRKTTLTGEAYFKIAENLDRDFIIQVEDLFIKDIGTTFNVKAYPQSDSVSVYVETGEVVIYTATDSLHIRANETGYYRKGLNVFSKTNQPNQNILAYKTQVLIFDNAQLSEVVEAVNEVYDRKLKLSTKELERCRITVTFKHESIEVIAEVIAETLSLTVEKTNPEIILNGNGCAK